MIPILFTPEHEVLETAGLDALVSATTGLALAPNMCSAWARRFPMTWRQQGSARTEFRDWAMLHQIYLRVLGLGIKFFVVVTVLAYLICEFPPSCAATPCALAPPHLLPALTGPLPCAAVVPIHLTASRDIQPNPELLALIGVEGNLTTGFSISQPFTSISIVRVGIDSKKYWYACL